MRFGFITCVQLGRACIDTIYDVGGELAWMGTLHDELSTSKSGRVYLDDLARQHTVPLSKFRHVNDADAVAAITAHDLDWLFIIGWSQIAGPAVLEAPRRGVLGMHPTLLPEGRGRAAIPWAIIKGLEETGVTLFQLDSGVDTGPIVDQIRIPIAPDETSNSLYGKAALAHKELIRRAWPGLNADTVTLQPQDEARATVWPGRTPDDGKLDPGALSTDEFDRHVRALTRPYPGAYIQRSDGSRLRVWSGFIAPSSDAVPDCAIRLMDGWFVPTDYEREF